MLDIQLLDELEDRWRDQSPVLLNRLRPGIDEVEIDQVAAPLGYAIPEEVRRWYRWHNGSTGRPIIFTRCLVTLASSVAVTLDMQRVDETWPRGWMLAMDEKPDLIFDCRGERNAPVPVWHLDYSFDFPTRPVFDSIGDMVSFWIDLIDDGQISWDADGEWHIREPVSDSIHQRIRGVPTD
jgi:hypothetical protein